MAPLQAFDQTSLGAGVGVSQESLRHSLCMSSPPTWPTRKALGETRVGRGGVGWGVWPTCAQSEHVQGARWASEGGSLLSISEPLVTALLCRAAEAVLQGRAETILTYHQQNVPRAKLDQVSVIPCLALR